MTALPRYRIIVVERAGAWVAHAERAETGARFGIECSGSSESEAADRLEGWLVWQDEHASALAELQEVQRAYHRTLTGEAFGRPGEPSQAMTSLNEVEAAGARLSEIRARMPGSSS